MGPSVEFGNAARAATCNDAVAVAAQANMTAAMATGWDMPAAAATPTSGLSRPATMNWPEPMNAEAEPAMPVARDTASAELLGMFTPIEATVMNNRARITGAGASASEAATNPAAAASKMALPILAMGRGPSLRTIRALTSPTMNRPVVFVAKIAEYCTGEKP